MLKLDGMQGASGNHVPAFSFTASDPVQHVDAWGLLSIPPSIPNTKDLVNAVKRYNKACASGKAPSDFDCHTICDAFYGNIHPTLVANCMLNCGDCELGKFCKKNPIKPPKTKPKKPNSSAPANK